MEGEMYFSSAFTVEKDMETGELGQLMEMAWGGLGGAGHPEEYEGSKISWAWLDISGRLEEIAGFWETALAEIYKSSLDMHEILEGG